MSLNFKLESDEWVESGCLFAGLLLRQGLNRNLFCLHVLAHIGSGASLSPQLIRGLMAYEHEERSFS